MTVHTNHLLVGLALLGLAPGCVSVNTNIHAGTLAMLDAGSSETEREGRLDRARLGDDPPNDAAIKGTFWTGVVVGTVGTAMAVGFGGAGLASANAVERGFEEGITEAKHDKLNAQGATFNALAVTGLTLGVVGLGVAAIAAGIDRTRCGPLRREKLGCTPR